MVLFVGFVVGQVYHCWLVMLELLMLLLLLVLIAFCNLMVVDAFCGRLIECALL